MTVRNNTVRRSQSVLSLRHGNRNRLYANVVLGEGRPGTGGIRIYGADNRVFNNYVAGTTGRATTRPCRSTAATRDPAAH